MTYLSGGTQYKWNLYLPNLDQGCHRGHSDYTGVWIHRLPNLFKLDKAQINWAIIAEYLQFRDWRRYRLNYEYTMGRLSVFC